MVTHYGYCPSLRKKVEFAVSEVNDIPTSRGIKYQIKGNFEGRLCNTFCSATKAAELRTQVGSPKIYTVMEAEESQSNLGQATQEEDVPTIIGPSQMAYGQEGEAAEALPLAETVPIPIISAIDMTLQPIDDLSLPDATIADMQETLDVPPTMDANFEIAEMQPEGDGSSIGNIAPMNPDAPLHAEEFDAEDDEVDSEEIERFQLNLTEPEFVMGAYMILIGKDSTPTQTIEDKKIAITELLNENYENKEFWTQVRNELGKETRIGSFRERKETKLQNVTERRYSWIRRGAGQLHTQDYRIRAKRNENGIYDIVNSWGVIGTANSELEVREGLWWSAEEFGAEESQENLGQATQEESVPTIIGPSQEAYGQEGEAAEALPIAETIPTSIISAVDMNIESNDSLASFNGGDILTMMESNLGERPTIMADFTIRPNEPFGDGRSIGNIAPMNPDVPFASEDDDMKYPCGECYYCINGVEDCDGTYWEAETFDAETFSAQDIEVMAQVPPPVCFVEKIPPEVWANTTIEDQMHYARTKDEGVLNCPQCGISKANLRGQGGYCGTTDPEGEEYIQSRSCPYDKYFAPQHWIEEPKVISHITPTKIVLEPTLIAEMDMPPINQLKAGITQKLIPTFLFNRINDLLPQGVVGNQTPDGMNYELTYYGMDTDAVEELVDIEEGEYDFMFASEQYTGNVVKSARGFELQAESVSIITPNKRTVNNYRIGDKKVRELDDGTLERYEAQRIQYDYMVHREPSGTEVGSDGKRITNPTGGRFTSADAESFESSENYYDREYRGFIIHKEGDSRSAFYYLRQGDNYMELYFDKNYGEDWQRQAYPYSFIDSKDYWDTHNYEKRFTTLNEATSWFEAQIQEGRNFGKWRLAAESLGAESFEAKSKKYIRNPKYSCQVTGKNYRKAKLAHTMVKTPLQSTGYVATTPFEIYVCNGCGEPNCLKNLGAESFDAEEFGACGREDECAWCYHIPHSKDPRDTQDIMICLDLWEQDEEFEAESFGAEYEILISDNDMDFGLQHTTLNNRDEAIKEANRLGQNNNDKYIYVKQNGKMIYLVAPDFIQYEAESKKKPIATAEKAILTGASTGATMELADALLAAESFEDSCPICSAKIFDSMEYGMMGYNIAFCDNCDLDMHTCKGSCKCRDTEGKNTIPIGNVFCDCGFGQEYGSRTPCESCEPNSEKIEKHNTKMNAAESFEATAYSMIENQDDYALKEIADSLRPKYNLELNEGDLSWDFDMDTGNVILYIYDGDNNKLDEITYDRKTLAKALKEQGHKNPESWGAESFNVEFDDWADQEMKTHGGNISFKKWAKEEGKKHGDVPITDWAEHEEESHDERYGAESFSTSNYREENGVQINRKSKNRSLLTYKDVGGILYKSKDNNWILKIDSRNIKTEVSSFTGGIETFKGHINMNSSNIGYGAENCEHFWDVSRNGENYNRCLTCGGTNQGDGWLAENTPSTMMNPPLKSIGILLGLGAIAAVVAPENLKKMFKR